MGMFIRDDDDLVEFRYDSDAGAPISVSLPLDGTWDEQAPEAFLDNLLPDEETARHAMLFRLGAASTDVFDLLDGVDSTGGLVFTRSDDAESITRMIEPVDENMLDEERVVVLAHTMAAHVLTRAETLRETLASQEFDRLMACLPPHAWG
nr:HipA N-terminal domain-containing protein [Bifidobacterium pseudolongum]